MQHNNYLPVDLCLNFSLFIFLHFQGLKRRPREANRLLQWMGAACDPEPRDSAWMEDSFSTSSAVEQHKQLHVMHFSDGTFCAISVPTAEDAAQNWVKYSLCWRSSTELGQIQSLRTHSGHGKTQGHNVMICSEGDEHRVFIAPS